MARNLARSNAHFRRAVTRLPLGVASNFRYWGEDRTIYVKYGRGARVVDIDDNSYVDYRLGYGPAIRSATTYSRSVASANTPPTSMPARAAASTRGSA